MIKKQSLEDRVLKVELTLKNKSKNWKEAEIKVLGDKIFFYKEPKYLSNKRALLMKQSLSLNEIKRRLNEDKYVVGFFSVMGKIAENLSNDEKEIVFISDSTERIALMSKYSKGQKNNNFLASKLKEGDNKKTEQPKIKKLSRNKSVSLDSIDIEDVKESSEEDLKINKEDKIINERISSLRGDLEAMEKEIISYGYESSEDLNEKLKSGELSEREEKKHGDLFYVFMEKKAILNREEKKFLVTKRRRKESKIDLDKINKIRENAGNTSYKEPAEFTAKKKEVFEIVKNSNIASIFTVTFTIDKDFKALLKDEVKMEKLKELNDQDLKPNMGKTFQTKISFEKMEEIKLIEDGVYKKAILSESFNEYLILIISKQIKKNIYTSKNYFNKNMKNIMSFGLQEEKVPSIYDSDIYNSIFSKYLDSEDKKIMQLIVRKAIESYSEYYGNYLEIGCSQNKNLSHVNQLLRDASFETNCDLQEVLGHLLSSKGSSLNKQELMRLVNQKKEEIALQLLKLFSEYYVYSLQYTYVSQSGKRQPKNK